MCIINISSFCLSNRFTNASCDSKTEWCTIEHWITLGCLYIGAIFYSLLISSISSILHSANQASRKFDEHLLIVDDYMRTKKLPAAMREKVKDYFHLQFSSGKLHKEEEILDFLSPVLRREIKEFTGRDICKRVPMLSMKANTDFAAEISCCIEPNIVFADETIMREKTTGDEMFFIHSGVVEIYVASSQLSSYVAIGDGCVSTMCLRLTSLTLSMSNHSDLCSILVKCQSSWASNELPRPNPRPNACSIEYPRPNFSRCSRTIRSYKSK